jgi:D-alanyl-D-alanine dipeptidase
MDWIIRVLLLGSVLGATGSQAADKLPAPLIHLADVDPSIRQEIRYATANNFTGAKVPGYEAPECILLKPVAEALKQVQADLAKQSLALKVYDCYRPKTAVRSFVTWVGAKGANKAEPAYFPRVKRGSLIEAGYIAAQSGHSTGAAVDLTLIRLEAPTSAPKPAAGGAAESSAAAPASSSAGDCAGPVSKRAPDDSIDMGTGYDCFDAKSHTRTPGLSKDQQTMRAMLVDAMARHGFRNYKNEWWHFSHASAGQSFDVPVTPRMISAGAPVAAEKPAPEKPNAGGQAPPATPSQKATGAPSEK